MLDDKKFSGATLNNHSEPKKIAFTARGLLCSVQYSRELVRKLERLYAFSMVKLVTFSAMHFHGA